MFTKKLRLFKIHYIDICGLLKNGRETIVIAKDELHATREFYKHAIHASCDITKIEEYEVEKVE